MGDKTDNNKNIIKWTCNINAFNEGEKTQINYYENVIVRVVYLNLIYIHLYTYYI